MTTYAVHAQVFTDAGNGFTGSRQVPTFYLDSRVQGITDRSHAARIAAEVIDPLGAIGLDRIVVTAVPVDTVRESADLDAFCAEHGMSQAARGRHAREFSGEFDADGAPIPRSAFAGNPGHVTGVAGTEGMQAKPMGWEAQSARMAANAS